jgi:hypothetical protein
VSLCICTILLVRKRALANTPEERVLLHSSLQIQQKDDIVPRKMSMCEQRLLITKLDNEPVPEIFTYVLLSKARRAPTAALPCHPIPSTAHHRTNNRKEPLRHQFSFRRPLAVDIAAPPLPSLPACLCHCLRGNMELVCVC